MKIINVVIICFFLFFAHDVVSQDKLLPNRIMSGDIQPGKTQLFSITLNDGDYVSGSVSQHGKVDVTIVNTDGSIMRGNVFSQSGPFWWAPDHNGGFCGPDCVAAGYKANRSTDATTEGNLIAREYLASEKLPLRFYLEAGTFEIDKQGEGGDVLEPTRHLRDVLRAKGYEVHYRQFVGGHDGLSWRGGVADALIALLGFR
jgi:hypothetical protein